MNILFFLTPKVDVTYVNDSDSLRQVLEKMERRQYSTIPIINEKTGKYVGTLSEGDLLWESKKHCNLTLKSAEDRPMRAVKRRRDYRSVNISSDMEDLLPYAMSQNFVPVTDDTGAFIGIVTRADVMRYLIGDMKRNEKPAAESRITDQKEFRVLYRQA
ncbi:MAG: CBS domain-containing protein [Lachnospiraceae bacterium]|nr:CBS domain-containing protein [Lachnospiraceae bacterium]